LGLACSHRDSSLIEEPCGFEQVQYLGGVCGAARTGGRIAIGRPTHLVASRVSNTGHRATRMKRSEDSTGLRAQIVCGEGTKNLWHANRAAVLLSQLRGEA